MHDGCKSKLEEQFLHVGLLTVWPRYVSGVTVTQIAKLFEFTKHLRPLPAQRVRCADAAAPLGPLTVFAILYCIISDYSILYDTMKYTIT